MATLPELPTSEVIELARSYLNGWSGIPLPDDIASEALNRLDIALAAVRQAVKERDELQRKVEALAVENAALKNAMSVTLEHVSVMDTGQAGVAAMIINDALNNSKTPDTDAALEEVRAKEAKYIFDSILDNPAVTDLGSLVDWLQQHSEDLMSSLQQLRKESGQ